MIFKANPSPAPQHPLGGGYGGQAVGGLGSIGSILGGVLSDAATNKVYLRVLV